MSLLTTENIFSASDFDGFEASVLPMHWMRTVGRLSMCAAITWRTVFSRRTFISAGPTARLMRSGMLTMTGSGMVGDFCMYFFYVFMGV